MPLISSQSFCCVSSEKSVCFQTHTTNFLNSFLRTSFSLPAAILRSPYRFPEPLLQITPGHSSRISRGKFSGKAPRERERLPYTKRCNVNFSPGALHAGLWKYREIAWEAILRRIRMLILRSNININNRTIHFATFCTPRRYYFDFEHCFRISLFGFCILKLQSFFQRSNWYIIRFSRYLLSL